MHGQENKKKILLKEFSQFLQTALPSRGRAIKCPIIKLCISQLSILC